MKGDIDSIHKKIAQEVKLLTNQFMGSYFENSADNLIQNGEAAAGT